MYRAAKFGKKDKQEKRPKKDENDTLDIVAQKLFV